MKKRFKKIIEPRLQLKFAAAFAATAGLAVIVQSVVLNNAINELTPYLPHDRLILAERAPAVLGKSLLITFALMLPLSVTCGVIMSFRLTGPVFAFKRFLQRVISGEQREPCRIRAKDELQELCELLNQVTEPQREKLEEPEAERRAA